jgi:hypothetical protein
MASAYFIHPMFSDYKSKNDVIGGSGKVERNEVTQWMLVRTVMLPDKRVTNAQSLTYSS